MPLFRKNIISNHVVKSKTDKIMKRTLRDARKKIKKGELVDSHDLALYLSTIDARYAHIRADVENATRVIDYAKIRAEKVAETRKMIVFFNQEYAHLDRLSQIVTKKAEEADRIDDFKHEKITPIDMSKLRGNFDSLFKQENDNEQKEK